MNEIADRVAFPQLSEGEMQCLETLGTTRPFSNGEFLLESGQSDYSFFAIKSGAVAIR